jgi:acetyl esterase/lipase
LARLYAPELHLEGVAAAAPATELASLFADDLSSPTGKILTAMTLWSWSRVYHAPLAPVVAPEQLEDVNRIARACLENLGEALELRRDERPLQQTFLKVDDITRIDPWRGLMASNTPVPALHGVPVFIAQGTADKIVAPNVTMDFAGRLCRSGSPVYFREMPNVSHSFAARDSAAEAVKWMAGRFEGQPAPSNCIE